MLLHVRSIYARMEHMVTYISSNGQAQIGNKVSAGTEQREKLHKLATEIKAGTYKVRPAELADRILQKTLVVLDPEH